MSRRPGPIARFAVIAAVFAISSAQAEDGSSIHRVAPEVCQECHEEIYA